MMRIAFRSTAVAAAALALAGCSTLSNIGDLFGGGGSNRPTTPGQRASPGPRVNVLATNQALTPSEALASATFAIPEPVEVTEWPYPGHGPTQLPPHAVAAPTFQIAWRRGIGEGTGDGTRVTATPVASGGRVFVMDGMARVSAWDAASGARVWSVDLRESGNRDGEAFGGGLAIADGRLYVTSGFRFVAALNPADGSTVWRRNVDTPIHGAPTPSAGRVFYVDLNNNLHAVDATSGAEAWNYQALIESARIAAASSPAVLGDAVIATFGSGEVASLRVSNGQPVWSETLSRASRTSALSEIRDIPGRPVVSGESVFAVSHSGVFASLNARTGAQNWQLPLVGITTPLPAGDVVYIVDRAGQLVCASRDSGQVYWVRDLSQGRTRRTGGYLGLRLLGRRTIRPTWSSPVLASGRLVMANTFGEVVSVNAQTGEVQGAIQIGSPAFVSPIAVNGMVFLVTDRAELIAIR